MQDFGSVCKKVDGNEGDKCHYSTRLDTYGRGCSHDCKYCYAKSLLTFRGLWNPQTPAISPITEISKAIRRLPRDDVIRLGGMTDCFQPVEKLYRNTYKTIKLLNRRRIPYLIVTKSAMVAESEYLDIMDKDLAHIQITVTTLNDELCATYEKASPPSARLKAIKVLQDAGYDVQLRLSPLIPEYMDLSRLNALGVDKILIEFLRVNSWIKKWFDIDYSPYTLSHGGYWHMPLERKLVYMDKIITSGGFKEISVCEDEDRAYKYWQEHINHNPDDCCNLRR